MAEDGAASVVVVAPDELDFATAPAFERGLDAAFATGGVVVADLSRMTFCDSSGLKVLVHAAVRATARGQGFELREPPRMLRRMAAILGASGLLGLPVDERF